MIKNEITEIAQGSAVIPFELSQMLDAIRSGKKQRWWEGPHHTPQGIRVVAVTYSLESSDNPHVNALVGDPHILEQGKFEFVNNLETKAEDLQFILGQIAINLGDPLSSGVEGEKEMLTLGGRVLKPRDYGALSTRVLSSHMWLTGPRGPKWLGLTKWQRPESLTTISALEGIEPYTKAVLKVLIPFAYGLVNLTHLFEDNAGK